LFNHRQSFYRRIEARAFRFRPNFQRAIQLQPKIVVTMRSAMQLQYKNRHLAAFATGYRFRRIGKSAFAAIGCSGMVATRSAEDQQEILFANVDGKPARHSIIVADT